MLSLVILGVSPAWSLAATELPETQKIIITELLTGTPESGTEEFIELYNPSENEIDLSSWQLQYFSANTSNWSSPGRSIQLSGVIEPNEYFLVASTTYKVTTANVTYSSTLGPTGGHIRLIQKDPLGDIVHDILGWGTASMPHVKAAPAPSAGDSLVRQTAENGTYLASTSNETDYLVHPEPSPGIVAPLLRNENLDETESSKVYLTIEVSELLPNPGAPALDGSDEFVELFNPHPVSIDLNGYEVKSGLSGTYKYTFASEILGPGEYLTLYSRDTSLTLSNSGSQVRIFSPDGDLLYESGAYQNADENQAWALIAGTWVWTSEPTPSESNIFAEPSLKPVAAVKKPTTTKKRSTAVKARTTTKKSKVTENSASTFDNNQQSGSLHPVVLAGVGSTAVLYGLYEYRTDVANRMRRLKEHYKAWRTGRQAA